jgi:hypothetical protein
MDNPIPEELRTDYLFLLVGSNPLPGWVAASLLLQDRHQGKLFLVHTTGSSSTQSVAQRLEDYLRTRGFSEPGHIEIQNGADPAEIIAKVAAHVRKLHSGTIGLNYTGGTKVMAVHTYRAIQQATRPQGIFDEPDYDRLVFSYLDASRLKMIFDPAGPRTGALAFDVNLAEASRIDIQGLAGLHGDYLVETPCRTTVADRVRQEIANFYSGRGIKKWRTWCRQAFHRAVQLKPENEEKLGNILLPQSGDLRPISQSMANGRSIATTHLKDVYLELGFDGAYNLACFLDGAWLEQHALSAVQACAKQNLIQDYGANLHLRSDKRHFEADVFAIEGYQLYMISCYSGDFGKLSRNKLFEAFVRARQLGGDEARLALLCGGTNVRAIQDQLEEDWDAHDRIHVFGLSDLSDLPEKFRQWFEQS